LQAHVLFAVMVKLSPDTNAGIGKIIGSRI
jgi:hypothetical protein